jgi:hypothetical protein
MRIPDCYWWLQRGAGIAQALVVVVFAVWFVMSSLLVLSFLGADEVSRVAEVAVCALAGGIVLMFAQAIFTIRGASRSRDRYRHRLAAIQGEWDRSGKLTSQSIRRTRPISRPSRWS